MIVRSLPGQCEPRRICELDRSHRARAPQVRKDINSSRCRGLMQPGEFRERTCGIEADRFSALRRPMCGEIVDKMIVQNRVNTQRAKVHSYKRRAGRRVSILAVRTHYPSLRPSPVMGRTNG